MVKPEMIDAYVRHFTEMEEHAERQESLWRERRLSAGCRIRALEAQKAGDEAAQAAHEAQAEGHEARARELEAKPERPPEAAKAAQMAP